MCFAGSRRRGALGSTCGIPSLRWKGGKNPRRAINHCRRPQGSVRTDTVTSSTSQRSLMSEVNRIKADLIARTDDASRMLQNCQTAVEAAKVVAELVEEFAYGLGPAAYSAKSRADKRELARLVALGDLVLDVAALAARADLPARTLLTDSSEVAVVGMLTALAEARAQGHVDVLLAADVAAMLYGAEGWVGPQWAAEQVAGETLLAASRASAQHLPASYEREANAIAWMSGFNPDLERKRRVGRLKQLARQVRGRSEFPRTGWVRWKLRPEALAALLANGVRPSAE